ncbi:MAG: serine--tRNA ligase, partial [Lysinibacillus sp.]
YEEIKKKLSHRNEDLGTFDHFEEWDVQRRDLIAKTEVLKAERNKASEAIGLKKRNKENADAEITQMRELGDQIKALDTQLT